VPDGDIPVVLVVVPVVVVVVLGEVAEVAVAPVVAEELSGCALLVDEVLGFVVVVLDAGAVVVPAVLEATVGAHGTPRFVIVGLVPCGAGVTVCADGVAVCGVAEGVDGGVAVCGVGVAVCGVGVAVCGVGVAVCATGVAVCGAGEAVCAGGAAAVCAKTAARQNANTAQNTNPVLSFIEASKVLLGDATHEQYAIPAPLPAFSD
jgi:hypothetical protein